MWGFLYLKASKFRVLLSQFLYYEKAGKSPTPLYCLHLELYYIILCGVCNDACKGFIVFPVLTHSSDIEMFCCP